MKRESAVRLLACAAALMAAAPAAAQSREGPKRRGEAESLFLDLSKVHLGTITNDEDKKKYLYTIQLEKARITRKTLRAVYENAHDLYRSGDFEGSRDLTTKILSIDPGFEDASILQRASIDLEGSRGGFLSSSKLADGRFDDGIALYRQGRLVESAGKLEEVVKLSPSNLKARYWLKKVRGELSEEHFRRGQLAYRQHRLREALDQWYAALVLNPRFPRLVGAISKVETELRQAEANEKLQAALQLYSEGRSEESLKALDEVLQIEPGDAKAQRLMAEIRSEIAKQHEVEGRKLYAQRKFNPAIAEWKKAMEFGYDGRAGDRLIAQAKDQMRREVDAKKKAEEDRAQRAEAAQKKEEEDAQRKEEEAKKAAEEAQKVLQTPEQKSGALGQPAPGVVSEENKKNAIVHWNSGIIYFQKGELEKARDEWILCKQLDAANSDCLTGLQRIDQQFGGP